VGRKCEKGHGHEAGMVAPTTNVLKFTFTSLMLQYLTRMAVNVCLC